MLCPFCGVDRDRVIDSRSSDHGKNIRRRRECLNCHRRFTTYERVEDTVKLSVIKKDGSRVPYDSGRLRTGIEKACYKRPVPAEQLQQLVEEVEDELFRTYDKEVQSRDIGRIVSDRLKAVDQVAYVRYASVYKEFRDIEDLFEEVKQVIEAKQQHDTANQGKLFQ